jgi:DNA-binding transcriptional LysR family regulator
MGLAYMPAWLAAEDLKAGAIEQVLAEQSFFAPKPTLYAAYTSRKYMATKVRTFIDFLSRRWPRWGEAA